MWHDICSFMQSVIYAIASIYIESKWVGNLIVSFLGIFVFHKKIYAIIGLFFTRKFKRAENNHRYAILIAARNEEPVIGNLIESIKKQDYPAELLTTFVVADNCTDNTAKIAREKGAFCYERFDDERKTKGYALQFLFQQIERDYGIEYFEGYFIFDADNLLDRKYVARMNDAFDEGEKIITSYRATKNFDENWIASTYALHWLRSIRFNHRARSVLHLATNIQGTGFLFANELVKDGWKYTSLTEDRAFTADAVAHGYEISYNDEAVFFDEQPTNLRIAFRQRIRWSRGHLLAFLESGWSLFKNIFVGNCFKPKEERHRLTKKSVLEGICHRFASFDTLGQLMPTVIVKVVRWLLVSVIMFSCYSYRYGLDTHLFSRSNWLMKLLTFIFGSVNIKVEPGMEAMLMSMILAFIWNVIGKWAYHFKNMLTAVYIFIMERKRIKKISIWKKILYCITWPTFDIFYRWSMYIAVFKKVTWKQIPHTSAIKIEDIEAGK